MAETRRRLNLRSPNWAPRSRTWPMAPLLERFGGSIRALEKALDVGGVHTSSKNLGRGAITDQTADRYAIALGLHPGDIWPGWHDVELDPWDLPGQEDQVA